MKTEVVFMSARLSQPSTHLPDISAKHHSIIKSRQHGAIAIMFVFVLVPILGICALALDLAMVYNRKTEMYNLATAVAISAAKSLNGTPGGIDNALAAAANIARVTKFKNHTESITWSSAALKFSTSADRNGQWIDAAAAASIAARIFYAKVDTSELADMGTVNTALAAVLSNTFAEVHTNSEAIAGRTGIAITPLAICAMLPSPATPSKAPEPYVELIEYGFRRGISYNLMKLSPNGIEPLNFIINPLSLSDSAGATPDFTASTVGPYVCNGSLGIPGVTGGTISVASPFPLASLFRQLNSRFDQYEGGVCNVNAAPPDYNIKQYRYSDMVTLLGWLTTVPEEQTAVRSTSRGWLETMADLPHPGGTAAQDGPLWAYAKAVAYATYAARPVEPAGGYTTMSTAAWPTLYGNQVVRSTYPVSTPYLAGAGVNLLRPTAHAPGIKHRRVLNVPLLDCSTTPSSSAKVLAVGKFFMTVPATEIALAAEFAGIIPFEKIPAYSGVFQ